MRMERKKAHTIESYAFYLFDHVRLLKPDFGCKSSKIMQWKRIKCPFNAHLKRVHRECIVQPITLRIHEHFQCLNEKVMFYIRIAHNKRLRDVNIVCARLLIRCACCCKIGSFSCSIQLSLDFFLYFSSLSRQLKLQFWSVSSALFNVHCELIMLVCVILNRFLSCIRTFHLFRFFRFSFIQSMFCFWCHSTMFIWAKHIY